MRIFNFYLSLLFISSFLFTGCSKHSPVLTLLSTEKIGYPSGSGVEYRKGKVFIIGDDSPLLYIMDSALQVSDSVRLTAETTVRVPWQTKKDYEDIAFTGYRQDGDVLLLGSGSAPPNRSTVLLFNEATKQSSIFSVDTLYKRLQAAGLRDINIEGITNLNGSYLLSNRGNKGFLKNYFIVLPPDFWLHPDTVEFHTMLAGINKDTATFNGISGLEYDYASDRLLVTVSTENTYSNSMDGEIGKSYLWIITGMADKENFRAINPEIIIDLNKSDARFKGHKIESVTIISQSRKSMILVFVADDDDGYTHLFKAKLDF